MKRDRCAENGFKLAYVWKYDWIDRRDGAIDALDQLMRAHELSSILRQLVSRDPKFFSSASRPCGALHRNALRRVRYFTSNSTEILS